MKNKTLAIFGIIMYILSVLSSAENLDGQSTAPLILIGISVVGNLVFLIMASKRLWKKERILAIIYLSSTVLSFLLLIVQEAVLLQFGSPIIILSNVVKVISVISFALVVIKLFKVKNSTSIIKKDSPS